MGGAVAVGRFNQWGGVAVKKRSIPPIPPWLRASAGEGVPRDAPNTKGRKAPSGLMQSTITRRVRTQPSNGEDRPIPPCLRPWALSVTAEIISGQTSQLGSSCDSPRTLTTLWKKFVFYKRASILSVRYVFYFIVAAFGLQLIVSVAELHLID